MRENGYVETLCGRRRYFPDINAFDKPVKRAQAERQAINTTIQGSAADIAKYAMVRMELNLQKNASLLQNKNVELVLHLHDELLYELPVDKSDLVIKILKLSMEKCVQLSVPLKVKVKKGTDWASMKTID